MATILYLDSVLVPLSLFIMVAYHANLWHNFKSRPSKTSIGIETLRRKLWFLDIKEGDDKKAMLAVQSLRNALMTTILTASFAILINLALAALTNNTYNASGRLFNAKTAFLEPQSGSLSVLKYGSTSLFLLVSFFCSSMAFASLIDVHFLIKVSHDFSAPPLVYTQMLFERGFMLALIGNRILCMSFPFLLWMFGPLPVVLSSVALVWWLYGIDFAATPQVVKA